MKHYNSDNHAKNLPDAYAKSTTSNNFKILEIERSMEQELRSDLREIDNILLLDNAKGKTLDLYGERLGQKRGAATDTQYLLMLKAKIMRTMSNGSYNSVVNAVAKTFGCDPTKVTVDESSTPCVLKSLSVPVTIINQTGLSPSQMHQIVQSLLPIGVRLDEYIFEGTFCFSDIEDEYDEEAGFAFEENAGEEDVGGTLGATGSYINDELLPID